MDNIFDDLTVYGNNKGINSAPIITLSSSEALDALLSNDFYCVVELPEYFDFSEVLKYAVDTIGNKTLDECVKDGSLPDSMNGVNLDVITNKDGR